MVEGDKEWVSLSLKDIMKMLPDCRYIAVTIHRWGHTGTLSAVKQAYGHVYKGFFYESSESSFERLAFTTDDKEAEQNLATLTLSGTALAQEAVHVLVLFRVGHQWFAVQAAVPSRGREAKHSWYSIQKFIRETVPHHHSYTPQLHAHGNTSVSTNGVGTKPWRVYQWKARVPMRATPAQVKPLESGITDDGAVKKMQMRVQVPGGATALGSFVCQLPTGGQVEVRVPRSAQPGDWVSFEGPRPGKWQLN